MMCLSLPPFIPRTSLAILYLGVCFPLFEIFSYVPNIASAESRPIQVFPSILFNCLPPSTSTDLYQN
jgi:hypothetical protein